MLSKVNFGRLLSKSAYKVIFLLDKLKLYIRFLLYLSLNVVLLSSVTVISAANPATTAMN